MQLERLSDKMDSCLQEVLSLKRISGNSSNVQVGPPAEIFMTDGMNGMGLFHRISIRFFFFWELLKMRLSSSFLDFLFFGATGFLVRYLKCRRSISKTETPIGHWIFQQSSLVVIWKDPYGKNQFSDQCCEHLRAGQLLIRGSCVSVSDMRLI